MHDLIPSIHLSGQIIVDDKQPKPVNIDHHIPRLEIAMRNSVGVQEYNSFQELCTQ